MAAHSEPAGPGRAREGAPGRGRRLRGVLLLAVAGCVAAAALTLMRGAGAAGARRAAGTGGGTGAEVAVTSVSIGPSVDYTGLVVGGGRLLLVDNGAASATAGSGGRCRVATVNPSSLQVASVTRGACNDPALFHQRALAVDQWSDRRVSGDGRVDVIDVRIATVSRHARSGYTLGPVVVSYQQCSDCWSESIDAARSVWIYAPFSTPDNRDAGEVLRVSALSGRVLERWAMPSLPRALLTVAADGLWIAPSIETGEPGGLSAAQQLRYGSLYHVAPGMSTPLRLLAIGTLRNPGLGARFLVAAGHTVWFETSLNGLHPRLWQIENTRVTIAAKPIAGPADCTDLGEGPATVAGNATMGIYCVAAGAYSDSGAGAQDVFRILPAQLEQRHVATVTPPPETFDAPAAVAFRGSYYFLDAQTPGHAGALFRVSAGH